MSRGTSATGSMDMLLDTMCNTFGGVCFIALMVAVMSAAIPKVDNDSEGTEQTEIRIIARETDRLRQRRDMLRASIDIQSEFIKNASTGVVLKSDIILKATDIAANAEKVRKYEKLKIEYLDELAKLRTRTEYSRREALRLERLLKELGNKAGNPLFDRHRVVRTPTERELNGLRSLDLWLHDRRLYLMSDALSVKEENKREYGGINRWDCRLIKGRGVLVDEFFETGKTWGEIKRRLEQNVYVRIFVDSVSFDELCLLRDALIRRRTMYNWIINEADVIHFQEGYDGRVQ